VHAFQNAALDELRHEQLTGTQLVTIQPFREWADVGEDDFEAWSH
jgi:hypothetical protein